MRGPNYKIICVVVTFVVGVIVTHVRWVLFKANIPSVAASAVNTDATTEGTQLSWPGVDTERPADFFIDYNRWTHDGYTIERKSRKATLDGGEGPNAAPVWVDVYYIVVKKGGKVLGRFDADVYFGLGNATDFALFPFLGGKIQQLFVSQDVFRGGCQWVVSLSPDFRIIFDGSKYAVGREGYDLAATDLDGDGVNEITAPITDFYSLSDKLSMYQVPLPTIIFKYDLKKREYVPANDHFQALALGEANEPEEASSTDPTAVRAAVLDRLLIYIYAGREKEAWKFYDRAYNLDDKEEIRRRVKSILRAQPVYKFIYNHRRRK